MLSLIGILILIHLPRLYIECKSRFFGKNGKTHCEDNYQKSRNKDLDSRIISWEVFDLNNSEWESYITGIQKNLIKFYKKEFKDLLKDVPDQDLVSFRNSDDVNSYKTFGEIICTWIDNDKKIIKSCFNHEYCSGFFFLRYGSIISHGVNPEPAKFPNIPFIPEYSVLKMAIKKPHLPISNCFNTDIKKEEIKRVSFNIDISNKPKNISSRTFILWNVMTILNKIHKKDYNIMIPLIFTSLKNIWNNVGAVFIKWPENGMDMETLDKTINDCKYQAIATNLYLRGIPSSSTGKNGRKNVDMIFTTGYIKSPKIISKYHLATFNNVPDYGIYCQTITYNKFTSISLTISTKQFNFDNLITNIKDKYDYKLF